MKPKTGIRKLALFTVVVVLTVIPLLSQTSPPAKKPSFEVASVKPSTDPQNPGIGVRGDRFFGSGVPLDVLMRWAYAPSGAQFFGGELIGLPDWFKEQQGNWFDIEAKADGPVSYEQVQLMVQSLLADRFQLRMHRESQEGPIYNLVVAKGGHKLKLADDQTPAPPGPVTPRIDPTTSLSRGTLGLGLKPSGNRRVYIFAAHAVSMEAVAGQLSPRLQRPVVNKTDLKGLFDFSVEFEFDLQFLVPGSDANSPTPATGATAASTPALNMNDLLMKALRDQVGLVLEPARAQREALVIESVQKPSEN
jgi:uncharacterized protein (TIGR03435 family)